MRRYSREMKEAMVAKLCSPGRPSYLQLAKETGIGHSTLHKWVKSSGREDNLQTKKRPKEWDADEKLQPVLET